MVLAVSRPDDGRGLYHARARGAGGALELGTLTPAAGGRLELRRTLEKGRLRGAGAWPVQGVECALTFSFQRGAGWQPPAALEAAFPHRPYFRRLPPGGRCRREGEGWRAEFPVTPKGFPMPELFCFASRFSGREGSWWVFLFDQTGWPVMPP